MAPRCVRPGTSGTQVSCRLPSSQLRPNPRPTQLPVDPTLGASPPHRHAHCCLSCEAVPAAETQLTLFLSQAPGFPGCWTHWGWVGRDASGGKAFMSSTSPQQGALEAPPHLLPPDSRIPKTHWKDGGLESPMPLVLSGGTGGNGAGGGASSVRGSWARGAISGWGLSDDTSWRDAMTKTGSTRKAGIQDERKGRDWGIEPGLSEHRASERP